MSVIFFFALFLIFVFCLEVFSFCHLSISMILLGWDRSGFSIFNPVRSARLVGRLTFIVFYCVMVLLL